MSVASAKIDQLDRTAPPTWIVWSSVAAIAMLVVGMIVSAPLLQALGASSIASGIYKSFSYLCHQIPERSFHLAGHQFAVCSRCTGLYAGFAFATLGYPLVRSLKRTDTPRIIWLVLATLPLVIDFALGYFSIWENNHFTRVTTGALLGAVAAFYVIPGLVDLSVKFSRFLHREA